MEPLSLFSVTIASILMSFSGNGAPIEEVVVKTHIFPEIAGLWNLELDRHTGLPKSDEPYTNTANKLISSHKLPNSLLTSLEALDEQSHTLTVNHSNGLSETVRTLNNDLQDTQISETETCYERYNFAADNKLLTTSGAEWTYGQYLYQHQENGLPILAIATVYDNNKTDCTGRQVDQTGESIIVFVDYQGANNTMRWCLDEQGLNCIMSFRRLLP